MIPARSAVPSGPHSPMPPEFQPGTMREQAQQMRAAVTIIGTTSGAGLQLPEATAWGGRRTSVRGSRLFYIAHRNNLAILNDGQPTFFKKDRFSALDATMISAHLMSTVTWCADIESHGSDHVTTYISLGCPTRNTQ
ncbi:hypothetical protein MTO96_036121 [Rhipicephalus appendiculatus]